VRSGRQRHGAGVPKTTPDSNEAYAGNADDVPIEYREGWLSG